MLRAGGLNPSIRDDRQHRRGGTCRKRSDAQVSISLMWRSRLEQCIPCE
ncbi:hypothetical protein L195_g056942, partial [Trifolium pratense]